MPDFPHEIHVEMFRNRGELARELLRGAGELMPELHERDLVAECISNEVVQVKPTQHRADSVILFRDQKGKARLAVVVEVQTDTKGRKPFTWPLYVAAVRERHECPTYLLVFATKPHVAKWAKATIDLGHPDFQLRPLVLTHKDVPKMNLEAAGDSLELVVLRALAHRTAASAKAAMKILRESTEEIAGSYLDAILLGLPPSVRKQLEGSMEGYVYKSDFFRKNIAKWRRVGRKQGMEKGMEVGVERGMKVGVEKGMKVGVEKGMKVGVEKGMKVGVEKGQQDAAIAVAREKLGELSEAQLAAIRALSEESTLTTLIVDLARASNAKKARAVLESTLH